MAKRSPQRNGHRRFDEVLNRRYDLPVVIDRENGVDTENRTVELSIASDAPIDHWFGRIILDMSPGSIRLDRMKQGAPLLLNHDADKQIGVLEHVRVESGFLRATARFSRSQFANEIFQDVQDGIRRNTSVGFVLHKLDLESKSDDGPNTYRSTDWEPLEGTIAAIPRDLRPGVNRDMADDGECDAESADDCTMGDDCPVHGENAERSLAPSPLPLSPNNSPQQIHVRSADMSTPNPNPATPPANALAAMTERQAAYESFALKFATTDEQKGEMTRLARDVALSAKSEDELFGEIKRVIADWNTKLPPAGPAVDLSKKERESYSISRAIITSIQRREGKDVSCLELDVSDEILKKRPGHAYRGGILIPTDQPLGKDRIERSGLDTQTTTKGPEVVFTEPRGFIDLLRAKMRVRQLGAQILSGLQGNIAISRQTGGATLYWVAENPGSDVTESDATLDQVLMSPKTAMAHTAYSRQLLAQANIDIDSFVKNDLSIIAALGIDKAAIHGSGSSNQPTGIYGQSGVSTESFASTGTTPGVITFPHVVNMETKIAAVDADVSAQAYLTTPEVRGTAKQTAVLSNTIARALWEDGQMNGYRAEVSNQVSKTLGAGSDHGILFGCWDQLIIGEWGAVELLTDPYTKMGQAMIRVFAFLMVDVAVRHPEAFCKGTYLKSA